jgi:hypothetical protein
MGARAVWPVRISHLSRWFSGRTVVMSLHTRLMVLGTVLAVALPAVGSAQATDGYVGSWVLNAAKSTTTTGKLPKSETRSYSAVPNGYKFESKTAYVDGTTSSSSGTMLYDGKYHATQITKDDSSTATRVDATTVKTQNKSGRSCTRVAAVGGKTMTMSCTSTDAAGKPSKWLSFYDKK